LRSTLAKTFDYPCVLGMAPAKSEQPQKNVASTGERVMCWVLHGALSFRKSSVKGLIENRGRDGLESSTSEEPRRGRRVERGIRGTTLAHLLVQSLGVLWHGSANFRREPVES